MDLRERRELVEKAGTIRWCLKSEQTDNGADFRDLHGKKRSFLSSTLNGSCVCVCVRWIPLPASLSLHCFYSSSTAPPAAREASPHPDQTVGRARFGRQTACATQPTSHTLLSVMQQSGSINSQWNSLWPAAEKRFSPVRSRHAGPQVQYVSVFYWCERICGPVSVCDKGCWALWLVSSRCLPFHPSYLGCHFLERSQSVHRNLSGVHNLLLYSALRFWNINSLCFYIPANHFNSINFI